MLTLWGAGPAIDDYARKEWSGMLSGYYHKRWQRFLEEQAKALQAGQAVRRAGVPADDLRSGWRLVGRKRDVHPTEPRGDSVAVAGSFGPDTATPSSPTRRA